MTKETGDTPPVYISFLLRLWQQSDHDAWRASLESVTTSERQGFPNLASLIAFLEAECEKLAARHQQDPPLDQP